jgi:hypothetical protein
MERTRLQRGGLRRWGKERKGKEKGLRMDGGEFGSCGTLDFGEWRLDWRGEFMECMGGYVGVLRTKKLGGVGSVS